MRRAVLKALFLIVGIILFCGNSHAANSVFISQTGGGTGASCASPLAASYFNTSGNWSGTPTGFKIGPGTTVFLCGTSITTNLTFQGSGAAGGSSTCGGGSSAVACTPVILDGTNLTGMNASIFLGGSANYWIIQNITWVTNYAGSNHVIDLEGASNGTIQNNVCDSFNGNTTDSDIIWIGAASGFSTNIDIKNNILGYANVVTGFQSDVIATERSSFVTIEGNVDTNRSPNTCGSCHDDMIQTFCGNSCASGQPPHDWTIRYNLFVMNTTVTTNKSCGIFEGMTGPLNIYGNVYEGLAGASGANCVVADGNAAGFVFNFWGNTIAEHSGGPNNLLNISGTGTFNVQDNIIYNTDAGNACTGGACAGMTRGGNLWFGPNIPSCSGVPTDLCGSNPLFTNFAGNDYSLQAGSPARSLGLNLSSSFTQYVLPEQTWPNPTLGTRPATGAWDSGYTQFSSGGGAVTFFPAGGVGLGNVIVNNSALVVDNLQNSGAATLNITSVTSSNSLFTVHKTCGTSLGAGLYCEIATIFTPTAIGVQSTTITMVDNAPGSPHTFTVTGTGVTGTVPLLDQYGGTIATPCANITGRFHVEKIGTQWTYCTPLGNSFFLHGVYVVDYGQDAGYQAKIVAKYGSTIKWAIPTLQRLQNWGFNSAYYHSNGITSPFATDASYPLDANNIHSIPIKLPFIVQIQPALYTMQNKVLTPVARFPTGQLLPIGSSIKDIAFGWPAIYNGSYGGFIPPTGEMDYYDPNFPIWLANYMQTQIPNTHTNPYVDYILGVVYDDSDELYGFGAGPDFTTQPPGLNNPHLGWLTATMTPVQNVLNVFPTVYTTNTVYTKVAWQTYLQGKYSTIAALNSAWGSTYTSFGSSGTAVTGEAVGTGDGTTKTFTHTIAHLTPSPYTVQILVNGTLFGGDLGHATAGVGNMYGVTAAVTPVQTLSGTINYASGALSLTFVTAPASGAAITVNYVDNAWEENGTGLMDEDGRTAHTWMGNNPYFLTGANANVVSDFNTFLTQLVNQYLSTCKAAVQASLPGFLQLGPDAFGSGAAPTRAQILQAVATNLDVYTGGVGFLATDPNFQAKLNFVQANAKDMPMQGGSYLTANPDSPYSAFPLANTFATQQIRGAAYGTQLNLWQGATFTATGSHPFVGMSPFEFLDIAEQNANFGLVTLLDNAYDGNEDVTGTVTCSAPLQSYTCGGQISTYGNYISCVEQANLFGTICAALPAPAAVMFGKGWSNAQERDEGR